MDRTLRAGLGELGGRKEGEGDGLKEGIPCSRPGMLSRSFTWICAIPRSSFYQRFFPSFSVPCAAPPTQVVLLGHSIARCWQSSSLEMACLGAWVQLPPQPPGPRFFFFLLKKRAPILSFGTRRLLVSLFTGLHYLLGLTLETASSMTWAYLSFVHFCIHFFTQHMVITDHLLHAFAMH